MVLFDPQAFSLTGFLVLRGVKYVNVCLPFLEEDDVTLYGCDMMRMLEVLEPVSVDAILTDPPYSSGGRTSAERSQSTKAKYMQSDSTKKYKDSLSDFAGDNKDQRGYLKWSELWISEAMKALKPGGIIGLFTDWRQLPVTTDALQAAGAIWRGVVPWHKRNARRQRGRYANNCEYLVWGTKGERGMKDYHYALEGFFEITTVSAVKRRHVTEKPVELMRDLVQIVPEGGTVLDPFMGSGTTGVACVEEGRRFIGCEVLPVYQQVARERITTARIGKAA